MLIYLEKMWLSTIQKTILFNLSKLLTVKRVKCVKPKISENTASCDLFIFVN